MKYFGFIRLFFYVVTVILVAGCERKNTVCPMPVGTLKPTLQLSELIKFTPVPNSNGQEEVEIGRKIVLVDKLVDYPICNDLWMGTVYVNCNATVAQAELDADKNPLFFRGCDLKIEPNTVVYVAAHNDAPYYKGCSCHTGEDPIP